MHKAILLLITITISVVTTQAQLRNMEGNGGTVLRVKKYERVDGSPYLFENYKNAKAEAKSGDKKSVFAKYDSYKDEIEVFNDGNPIILDKKEYHTVMFNFVDPENNQRVVVLFKNGYNLPGYTPLDYFQVLKNKGDYKLLKKISTQLIEDKETSYGGTNDVASKFITTEKYILLKGDEVYTFNKLSKNNLLSTFDNLEEDKVYLKKEKNKLKSEDDVVLFLLYKETHK